METKTLQINTDGSYEAIKQTWSDNSENYAVLIKDDENTVKIQIDCLDETHASQLFRILLMGTTTVKTLFSSKKVY